MNKEQALSIRDKALNAITELNSIFLMGQNYEEFEQIKKGIGISMGYIDMNILGVVYRQFPELDHIAKDINEPN